MGFTTKKYRCVCVEGYKGDHCDEGNCRSDSHTAKHLRTGSEGLDNGGCIDIFRCGNFFRSKEGSIYYPKAACRVEFYFKTTGFCDNDVILHGTDPFHYSYYNFLVGKVRVIYGLQDMTFTLATCCFLIMTNAFSVVIHVGQ